MNSEADFLKQKNDRESRNNQGIIEPNLINNENNRNFPSNNDQNFGKNDYPNFQLEKSYI